MTSQRKYAHETENRPFPRILRDLMKRRETTQEELASAIGVKRQTVSKYASGLTTPDIDTFVKIADFFKVSFDYLLGRSGSEQREHHGAVETTGLTEEAVAKLKDWTSRVPTDRVPPRTIGGRSYPYFEKKVTKAPRELSQLLAHPKFSNVIKYIQQLKGLYTLDYEDQRRIRVLVEEDVQSRRVLDEGNSRDFLLLSINNAMRDILQDIVPHKEHRHPFRVTHGKLSEEKEENSCQPNVGL